MVSLPFPQHQSKIRTCFGFSGLALHPVPTISLFPAVSVCVSYASQTGFDLCCAAFVCTGSLARKGFAVVTKFQFAGRRRRVRARARSTPPARVLLTAPQTHPPVPCLWAHGELTSCYSPHHPTTTLDSSLWTLATHASPWTVYRCEREDWEVSATTGLLGPSAWKKIGVPGGDIASRVSASRVSGYTVEGSRQTARLVRSLCTATDGCQLAVILKHYDSGHCWEQ